MDHDNWWCPWSLLRFVEFHRCDVPTANNYLLRLNCDTWRSPLQMLSQLPERLLLLYRPHGNTVCASIIGHRDISKPHAASDRSSQRHAADLLRACVHTGDACRQTNMCWLASRTYSNAERELGVIEVRRYIELQAQKRLCPICKKRAHTR